MKYAFKYKAKKSFFAPAKPDMIRVAVGEKTIDEVRAQIALDEQARVQALWDQYPGKTCKQIKNLQKALKKQEESEQESHVYSKEHWGIA